MYKKIALLVFASVFISVCAVAQCSAPSTSGTLRICYPSNGSTIIGSTTFEMSANLAGATIDKVVIYDNGVKVDSFSFLPSRLIEGAIHDGLHKVTVKAWDTDGHVYVATDTFTKVGGFDPWACNHSSTAGVTLCSPKQGGLQPAFSVPLSFAVTTKANTTAWKFYLDGKLVRRSDASTLKSLVAPFNTSAGSHRATVVAWDSKGAEYTKTHVFTAFNQYDCDPVTDKCTPGIVADAPDGFGPDAAVDAPQSFELHAETKGNTSPMQKMSVTLDGAVIAQGQGPGIVTTVHATPGSHTIRVQGMDTKGKLYLTYGTVNVQ
jgi:hypothetical protein